MPDLVDHFDTEALDMLREVMEEEFGELIQVYMQDSEARLPAIHQASDDGNAESLRELAHSFKGASSNIGAAALAKLCYELENAGRENRLENTASLIAAIEQEYDAVKALLQQML